MGISKYYAKLRLDRAAHLHWYGAKREAYKIAIDVIQDVVKESDHGPTLTPKHQGSTKETGKEVSHGRR